MIKIKGTIKIKCDNFYLEDNNDISQDFIKMIKTILIQGTSSATSYTYVSTIHRPSNIHVILMYQGNVVQNLIMQAKYNEKSVTQQTVTYSASYLSSSQLQFDTLLLVATYQGVIEYVIAYYTLQQAVSTSTVYVDWNITIINSSQVEANVYNNVTLTTATYIVYGCVPQGQCTQIGSGSIDITPSYLASLTNQTIIQLNMPLSNIIVLLFIYPTSQYSSLPQSNFYNFLQQYGSLSFDNIYGITDVLIFQIQQGYQYYMGPVPSNQIPPAQQLPSTTSNGCAIVGFLQQGSVQLVGLSLINIDGTLFMFTANYTELTTSSNQFWEDCVIPVVTGE